MDFIGVRLSTNGKDFVPLGCGTYFIEYNTVQYSTVVIIYDSSASSSCHLNGFTNGSNLGSTV